MDSQESPEEPCVGPNYDMSVFSINPGEFTDIAERSRENIGSDFDVKSNPVDQCYCMKERNPNMVELQCGICLRWFHESCITYQIGKCMAFMTNYTFVCKNCNHTGLESFTKKQANFIQMCQTAIANLMQESAKDGNPRILFSKDKVYYIWTIFSTIINHTV